MLSDVWMLSDKGLGEGPSAAFKWQLSKLERPSSGRSRRTTVNMTLECKSSAVAPDFLEAAFFRFLVSAFPNTCAGPAFQSARVPANAIALQSPGGGVVPRRRLSEMGGGTLSGLVGASNQFVHVHVWSFQSVCVINSSMCGGLPLCDLRLFDDLLLSGLPSQCFFLTCFLSGGCLSQVPVVL